MGTTQARKQPQPVHYDAEDNDALYETRLPSSARRYKPSNTIQREHGKNAPQGTLIQRRRSSLSPRNTNGIVSSAVIPSHRVSTRTVTTPQPKQKSSRTRRLPLLVTLIGMVVMILLILCLSMLASWWKVYQDDLSYGRPRTFHLDAVVGHADSASSPTHFIFINLHRQIQIIEIPGGNPQQIRTITGPILYGEDQELVPVTGEVFDVNKDGKPDLIIHLQTQRFVFLNDGKTFRPT